MATALVANDLGGNIVAVLLRVEDAPAVPERLRDFGTRQPVWAGITVGNVDTGDLVITFVIEAGGAEQPGVDRCRWVAALRHDTDRLVRRIGIILSHIEQVAGIERVALGVQRVARILHENDGVLAPKSDIVEARIHLVTEVEQGQLSGIGRRAVLGVFCRVRNAHSRNPLATRVLVFISNPPIPVGFFMGVTLEPVKINPDVGKQ